MRVGNGFDVHPFAAGRRLVLGGVTIPYPRGLSGHSDADALLHAICDAILGAIGEGDIGMHFPDTNADYKDVDSRILLRRVWQRAEAAGYALGNIDATVIAQDPKLAPYVRQMAANIATDCGARSGQVNVKATTTERLGFCGRGEGIAALASALLIPRG
ncbi:MAG TPA: 2-C-methyl-D-erythritol 2,4-cyclodiphosphate synthase [Casimicrobiaceae bacterium]|nr:2-C-methyl-D-erythritol 2,4-cyclodiphosphate synthase [Casimicrobiaceae bacterium]